MKIGFNKSDLAFINLSCDDLTEGTPHGQLIQASYSGQLTFIATKPKRTWIGLD